MTDLSRYKTAGIGVLLTVLGFLSGYMTGGQTPHCPSAQPQAEMAAAPPPPPEPHIRRDRRMMEMHWSSERPHTTVIVMQDGRPVAIGQDGAAPVAIANRPAPPREETHYGLLLAVLLLSLTPVATWAALAWNRRRTGTTSAPFTDLDPYHSSEPDQDFVPRRDD